MIVEVASMLSLRRRRIVPGKIDSSTNFRRQTIDVTQSVLVDKLTTIKHVKLVEVYKRG